MTPGVATRLFRTFTSPFRPAAPSFTAFEKAVLEAVMGELDPPLCARFARRLAAVTRIRRADGGRQVGVYQKLKGRIVFPDETRLTAADGDVLLARFTMISRRTLSALQGQVWLSDGNLSRLSFTQPTEHVQCDDIHRISAKLDGGFAAMRGPPAAGLV